MKCSLNLHVFRCGVQVYVAYSIAPSQAAAKLPVKGGCEVLSNKNKRKKSGSGSKQHVQHKTEEPSSLEDPRFLDDLDAMLGCVERTRPSPDLVITS